MAKKSKIIIKLIKDNYAWVIAIITTVSIFASYVLEFIEYLTSIIYFDYYGLNMNLYKFHDKNFFYSLCLSIIFIIGFGFVLYSYKQIKNNVSENNYFNKENAKNICIIVFANIYLVLAYCTNLTLIYKAINFVIFIIIEYLFSKFIFKERMNKNVEDNKSQIKNILINDLKSLFFITILLIICNSVMIVFNLRLVTKYRLIDENKVIVYSNNDYSLTLDCEKDGENLIIYKGTQTKIDNINVYSKQEKFEYVEIK